MVCQRLHIVSPSCERSLGAPLGRSVAAHRMVWPVRTEGEGTESDRRACEHSLPMRLPLSYIPRAAQHCALACMDRALYIHRPEMVEPVAHPPLVSFFPLHRVHPLLPNSPLGLLLRF